MHKLQIHTDGREMWAVKLERQEEMTKEFIAILKTLEEELEDKPHFEGENFGFVDVSLIPLYCWFHSY